MIKKLFSSLSMVALLFTACKKSDTLSGTGENQRTLTSNQTGPIAVVSPTVFFVENDVLFSVSNITAPTPTVTNKGIIPGIQIFDPITKSNVFNNNEFFNEGRKNSLYNPFTDQILSSNGNVVSKCFTPKPGTTSFSIDAAKFNFEPLAINPADKKLYYFCIQEGMQGEFPVPTPSFEIHSVNMDGTNDIQVGKIIEVIPNLNTCDIDFKTKLLYMPSADGNIYKTHIDGPPAFNEIFLPALSANETVSSGEVKVDPVHNTIFFSTTLEKEKRKRIWRIDASGNKASLKLITSIAFTDPNVTFNFDISPKTNTVFVCKRELTVLKQHHSIIMRVNMDGTASKIIRTGGYINTVVVAEPVL
jgi:hypothetical protein